MRVAIVTGDGPEHRYVANTIAEVVAPVAILVCASIPPRKWQLVLRKSPKMFMSKVFRKCFLALVRDSEIRSRTLLAVLGSKAQSFPTSPTLQHVGKPRDGVLLAKLKDLNIDVLAVYGTGKLPDEVLSQARMIAINLHTGISPWYRGTACVHWPIANEDYGRIGATIHECTSEVDGGQIYARKLVACFPGDRIHEVFARVIEAGAKEYARVISRISVSPLDGERQNTDLGREFTGQMLGIGFELKVRFNLWKRSFRKKRPS